MGENRDCDKACLGGGEDALKSGEVGRKDEDAAQSWGGDAHLDTEDDFVSKPQLVAAEALREAEAAFWAWSPPAGPRAAEPRGERRGDVVGDSRVPPGMTTLPVALLSVDRSTCCAAI